MYHISVNVNHARIPWALIRQPAPVVIRFDNTGTTRSRVTFTEEAPNGLPRVFNVDRNGVSFTIDVEHSKIGSYPYTVSGGSAGNGGIEIERASPSPKQVSK